MILCVVQHCCWEEFYKFVKRVNKKKVYTGRSITSHNLKINNPPPIRYSTDNTFQLLNWSKTEGFLLDCSSSSCSARPSQQQPNHRFLQQIIAVLHLYIYIIVNANNSTFKLQIFVFLKSMKKNIFSELVYFKYSERIQYSFKAGQVKMSVVMMGV